MAPVSLFVYGTLKRRMSHHALLADEEFVGAVRTVPCYRLYTNGRFPGLVEAADVGSAIHGELYRVRQETLQRLDIYEDVPRLFVRRPIKLEGVAEPVEAYFLLGELSSWRDVGSSWPH